MQLGTGLERKHWLICRVATQRIRAGFPGSFVPGLLVPGFCGSIPARLRILRRPAQAPILQLSSGSGQEAGGCEWRSVSSRFNKILLRPVIPVANIGRPKRNCGLYLEEGNGVVPELLHKDIWKCFWNTWLPSPHSLKLVIDTIEGWAFTAARQPVS